MSTRLRAYGLNADGGPVSVSYVNAGALTAPEREKKFKTWDSLHRQMWCWYEFDADARDPDGKTADAYTKQNFLQMVVRHVAEGRTYPGRPALQILDEMKAWADSNRLVYTFREWDTPAAAAAETVVPGPRKPPRTVIVQEWAAAMERERPGEIAVRAWDALHSLIAKGS